MKKILHLLFTHVTHLYTNSFKICFLLFVFCLVSLYLELKMLFIFRTPKDFPKIIRKTRNIWTFCQGLYVFRMYKVYKSGKNVEKKGNSNLVILIWYTLRPAFNVGGIRKLSLKLSNFYSWVNLFFKSVKFIHRTSLALVGL